jgi:hypothetical protein
MDAADSDCAGAEEESCAGGCTVTAGLGFRV